jgi:hypothetical protein
MQLTTLEFRFGREVRSRPGTAVALRDHRWRRSWREIRLIVPEGAAVVP